MVAKLAICVPMRGKVDSVFFQTYLNLFIALLKNKDLIVHPIFSDAMPLDKARNILARNAILIKADYILWVDADIVLNESLFNYAWETLHTPDENGEERFIVSGIYYEREIPYDAVIRRKNELGIFQKIMEYPTDKPFVVDGIGFGFVLMKAKPLLEAFEATKGYPFRWTEKVSEDLYFCDVIGGWCEDAKIIQNGKVVRYKIWCDPRIQVPHYGSYVTQWHHLHYKLDEYQDISELAKYLKMKMEECYNKCSNGSLMLFKEWKERFGSKKEEEITEDEILDFYRNTKNYLFDLTWHWSRNRQMREAIMNSWRKDAQHVLDFGCGIGDYGLAYLSENPNSTVDFFDINKHNIAYLNHRIKMRVASGEIKEGSARIISENTWEILKKEEVVYDMIFAIDVLEHLKHPEREVAILRKLLKRNGLLIAHVPPKKPFQPFHISQIDLQDHGFIRMDTYSYVRSDSDIGKKYIEMLKKIENA